jgi:hypothetical protein
MPLQYRYVRIFARAAFCTALFSAPSLALAVTVLPTTTLPGVVSYEYFGLNFVNNIETSTSVGTLDYGGKPGCGGICKATTSLGADPAVSVDVNEIEFDATSGGLAIAELGYYAMYYVPGGATDASYLVTLKATDGLSVPADSSAGQASLMFGVAGTSYSGFNNFASLSTLAVSETDCANRCIPGAGPAVTPGPFPAAIQFPMIENTLYFMQLEVTIGPFPDNVPMNGFIDPTLTSDATAGTLLFSPGVGQAPVPEPSTWAMMLVGFVGLGGFAAFRRRARDKIIRQPWRRSGCSDASSSWPAAARSRDRCADRLRRPYAPA